MNLVPSIISIRPRGAAKKVRNGNGVSLGAEETNLGVKLPSLSPSRSVRKLKKVYPVNKVGLIPELAEKKFLLASKSNSDFKPNKILSNLGKYRVNRIKMAPNYHKQTPSPLFLNQSETSLTAVSLFPKKLRSHLSNSIFKSISPNNKSFL